MLLTGAAALVLPLAGCSSEPASPSEAATGAETSGSTGAGSAGSAGETAESTATDVVDSFSDGRSTAADSGGASGSGDGADSAGGGGDYAELAGLNVKRADGASARVVFRFEDVGGKSELPSYQVKHLDGYPKAPGSGKPVEMAGQNFLGVTFTHATAGELPDAVEPELPTVAEVRYLGGFEKVQEAAIGVTSCHGAPTKPEYDVSKVDTAVVVEIEAADCSS